jgi:DNA modification methylase
MREHRLLCGDATKPEDFARLMDGARAAMTFTDSPYSVDYANNLKDKMRGKHRPILNDNLGDKFGPFLSAAFANILSVTDGGIYACMSSSELHTLYNAFTGAGGHWSTFLIWSKQTFTLGRSDFQRQYEAILYGWREGAQRYWCGARDQGDVWEFNKPAKNDLHPTQKPVELVMRAIRNSSERGGIVVDPFLGSGTTLIAAERTGRTCFGIELAPNYVDTAIRRWEIHTGEYAIHAGTGKTFTQLAAEMAVQNA